MKIQLDNRSRWRISVDGIVQGVGFRPFIYQLAYSHALSGWVCNTGEGVLIEVEGEEDNLRRFEAEISSKAPAMAVVSEVISEPVGLVGDSGFEIHGSRKDSDTKTTVPADASICPDCLADISTPGNRRYGYPFTNCTNCGPRFTIIERIPYDRPYTTMRDFVMCPDCRAEYENPLDRRFHAQPNACPVCGPHLTLDGDFLSGDGEVITRAAELLHAGKILAIKGLGGFHLACDARNTDAVRTLRERKGRGGKPFALMCSDIEEARRICEVDEASEKFLLSTEHPIVLMPSRLDGGISPAVAQGTSTLGVMLPYTPLHHLLLAQSPSCLVMTSGNLSEEPIIHLDDDALRRLGHIADHFVGHNRPIHMSCDDSVARILSGEPSVIRRARGYVPRPIRISEEMPQILACGGDLKNTFCLTKGKLALLSQHLGDLDNVSTMERYQEVVDHFSRFFEVKPEIIAHDLHPDYRSTRYAMSIEGCRKEGVQHHHAHIVSCMAENHISDPVIGIAFDGTGYGTDGAIWGGEFLIADYSDFRRFAHLAYVPLPGGEAAIKKPGRMALAYTNGKNVEVPGLSDEENYIVKLQIEKGINCPMTSSMGRLFDAVSGLLGICTVVTYEGQAAIELEGAAVGDMNQSYPYAYLKDPRGSIEIDMRPMFSAIIDDIDRGVAVGEIAGRFHFTISDMAVKTCCMIRDAIGLNQVALSGGVFQNALLQGMVLQGLRDNGFEVFRQSLVPCNDGGISLGQALVASRRSKS